MRNFVAWFLLFSCLCWSQHGALPEQIRQGLNALNSRKLTEARAIFESYVATQSADPLGHLLLGKTLHSLCQTTGCLASGGGLAAEADARFRKSLELAAGTPREVPALEDLARLAQERGRAALDPFDQERHYRDAITWNKRLIELRPDHHQALYSLGEIVCERAGREFARAGVSVAQPIEAAEPLRDVRVRKELREKFLNDIEEGLRYLERASASERGFERGEIRFGMLTQLRLILCETEEEKQSVLHAFRSHVGEVGRRMMGAPPDIPRTYQPERFLASENPSDERQLVHRVSADEQAKRLIYKARPTYPPLAKKARVQGSVSFTLVIAADGSVKRALLKSGHPLLVPAAEQAIRMWRYEPLLRDGVAVEVVADAEINFTLQVVQ